jgi:GNAT superfamily N-acetyltransferase
MIQFRAARKNDTDILISFIQKLAAHEGRPETATITGHVLDSLLYGGCALADAYLAEDGSGAIAAFAITAKRFSSFRGTRMLYLEDMFVLPEYRKAGVGKRMMAFLAHQATRQGCERIEWSALANNDIALGFYDHLGAEREVGIVHYSTTPVLMQKLLDESYE